MQVLETSIVLSLVFLLIFSALALLPQIYEQAQTAARLEVLAVYIKQADQSLYRQDTISCGQARAASLKTSPQRALELAGLVKDYYGYLRSWLAGDGA